MKTRTYLAGLLLFGAGIACLVIVMSRHPPEAPLPHPNGYDDFAKAVLVAGGQSIDGKALAIEYLRRVVGSNQPALALIRRGLSQECRVIPYTFTAGTNEHLAMIGNFKRLANLLSAASRLERLDGHTNEAAILGLDCLRFGYESTRGGVLIDGLVGLAIQSIGLATLRESLPATDAATARAVATTLENVANQRELPAALFRRESRWAKEGRFGSASAITLWIQPFLQRGARAKTELKFTQMFAQHQRLMIDAASRAYELDRGKPPGVIRDLVPQYLRTVPTDPTSGQELR